MIKRPEKKYNLLLLAIFSAAILISCASGKKIIAINIDGAETDAYIRNHECFNSYNTAEKYPELRTDSGWEKINPEKISGFKADGKIYTLIDLKKRCNSAGEGGVMAAENMLSGSVNLYRACNVVYQSTMFRSKKFMLHYYLIKTDSDDTFYTVPQDPGRFKEFASRHFARCKDLVDKIGRKSFEKRAEGEPGTRTYMMVDENEIKNFCEEFNSCASR